MRTILLPLMLALLSLGLWAAEPLPDDVEAYRQRYGVLMGELDAARDRIVAENLERCRRELELLLQNVKAQGNLDYVLAVQNELDRLAKSPTPAEDLAPKTLEHLRQIQRGFRNVVRQAEAMHDAALSRLNDNYVASLRQLERRLVAANRIEDAKKARQEVERSTIWDAEKKVPELGMELVLAMPGSCTWTCVSVSHKCGKPVAMALGTPYWVGTQEATQGQYQKVMGRNPSFHRGADLPVEMVSWYDAMEFCQKLTEAERAAKRLPKGYVYRLPTEAEWEWAARGARRGTGEPCVPDPACAWVRENAGAKGGENSHGDTHPVGQLKANAIGAYDMLGNVMEWCLDDYAPCRASVEAEATDPLVQTGSPFRPLRGAACTSSRNSAESLRCGHDPATDFRRDFGFRVVLAPDRDVDWERQKGSFAGTYKDPSGKVMVVLTADGKWTSPPSGWSLKDSHGGTWDFHGPTQEGRFDIAVLMLHYYKDGKSIRTYNTGEAHGYRTIPKLTHSEPWTRGD